MECFSVLIWLGCVFYYFTWFIGLCCFVLKEIAVGIFNLTKKIFTRE